ncbi:MAG TPA: alpha/beta hydrolase [Streptosporangiaceae bacterium]|nr:alpha/beta hydrolase [Streptosporangiaceae bacterium]
MTTFVLIPGAGGAAWFWHRVVPLIEQAGHEAIAVDLPADDESCGLPEYADQVASAAADREDVVLVGMSLGGFTAPMAAARLPTVRCVLVNAMIPVPGETAGAWWDNTGWAESMRAAAKAGGYGTDIDENVHFFHDVPAEILATGQAPRPEADAAFESVCEFESWPGVRVVAGAQDRFFPLGFQQKLARDRLGIEADVLPGGHLIALSRPEPLTSYLLTS